MGVIGYLQAAMYRRRCVTAIVYLNDEDWDASKHGGELRVYMGADIDDEKGGSAEWVIDVAPAGGTVVVFDSRVILHEVLPTSARRMALTLWICGDSRPIAAS